MANDDKTTTISIDSDGKQVEVTPDELMEMLRGGVRLTEVVVSVKESRQRAQYQTHERFLSGRIDFGPSWDLMSLVSAKSMATAKGILANMIHGKILETEAALYQTICEIQQKDGITPYERR